MASQQQTTRSRHNTKAALREVLFVGNNWDGTVDILDSSASLERIGRINAIPDREQRMREIRESPVKHAYFRGVRQIYGEGHDQFVDDVFSTPDGSAIAVSRPSFADVVCIGLDTGEIRWRFPVAGHRTDHMAVSPDSTRLAVSAFTARTVHVLDITTGQEHGSFPAGDKPHENIFTQDGRYIWNMSVGHVGTDLDARWLDWTKGDRHITIADATSLEVVRTINMRHRLNAYGRRDLSHSIRPTVFTPDETLLYFQVSYFNGLIEYDIKRDIITRIKTLPGNVATTSDRKAWVNDSRHHGIAISPDGTRLCIAGVMDNYATIIDRETLNEGPLIPASKPYWATVTGDGTAAVISESAANRVTAINFTTGRRGASTDVGKHPQRIRLGHILTSWTTQAAR
ncbi:YncE family protein [Streptomyces paromomycinus]|uniref:Serine/threonine protein kinase n=1 Tax=Streptomyces paromomycinus TaxID=92743 RepID=A0A401VXY4_STREY|nr:YncE family protein [Streptomyces paromomycinus]GCD41891.1 serine/threonine protein kinase [Streptomyces paromomycinus]